MLRNRLRPARGGAAPHRPVRRAHPGVRLIAAPNDPSPDDVAVAEGLLGGRVASIEPLVHSRRNATRGVWRLRSGEGGSLILKVVGPSPRQHPEEDDDRTAIHDRRREADILDGGLPAAYRAAHIRPPNLLRRIDRPAVKEVAVWLEDVQGRPAARWSLDEFAVAARRLGHAQGALAREGAGEHPPNWASRGYLRRHLAAVERPEEWPLLDDDRAWATADAAGFAAPGLRQAAVGLRDRRTELLSLVEAGPRTICHLDVWPNNLFETSDGTVMIDWAFAGVGGLGEDLGNLVPDSVFDLLLSSDLLAELDRSVFEAYVEGLRLAGWAGDARHVRLTMCAAAVKYAWVGGAALHDVGAAIQTGYGGQTLDDPHHYYAERAAVIRFLGDWADEALRLRFELSTGLRAGADRGAG